MNFSAMSIVLSTLYLTALTTSCATQQTEISPAVEAAIKKVVCKMVCEVSFSSTGDTQRTIAEIRVLNAVTRAKCGQLLRPCSDRVKLGALP